MEILCFAGRIDNYLCELKAQPVYDSGLSAHRYNRPARKRPAPHRIAHEQIACSRSRCGNSNTHSLPPVNLHPSLIHDQPPLPHNHARYDSFGNLVATSGSIVNNFRYTGREFDTETNLYYYRVRYYDPTTGRFLSGDPLGFFQGVNFYAYANNSPISLFDPWGLCPCSSSSSTPQNHPFFPITGGVSVGASAEAGLGSLGGTAMSGNLGFGESGSHMGIVASGGIGMA
jgi:RHS repeat-associated protein